MNLISNRREAIKTSIAASLAVMLPSFGLTASSDANTSETTITGANQYLVKHGHQIKDNKYLWSVLSVNNEGQFQAQIEQIIYQHRYYSKLAYSTNDKFKIDPANDIIDLILSPSSGVSFKMYYFSGNHLTLRHLSPSDLNLKTRTLYNHALSNVSNVNIIAKAEDRFGPTSIYNSQFSQLHGVNHLAKDVKFEPILQVNDLISGICYSIMSSKLLRSNTKISLNNSFNTKTNLLNLRNNNLINLPNITIQKINIS